MSTPSGELHPTAESRVSTTLFLADNNDADLHTVAQALTAAGHIVIKLTDGQQLLALLDRLVPDAILLTSGLPYHGSAQPTGAPSLHAPSVGAGQSPEDLHTYDGFTLCRLLAATTEWVDIPTILLAPNDDPAVRIRGLEMNAWDVVPKPCHLPELAVRINSLIKRAQFQRERSEDQQQMQATLQQQMRDLQRLHALQRQSEQKAELLLSTVYAHSRQLYLLMTLALQNAGTTQLLPRLRQQQLQQQAGTIQTFLDQLTTLVAALPSYPQELQPLQTSSHELQSPCAPFPSRQGEAEKPLPQRGTTTARCSTNEADTAQTIVPNLHPLAPTVAKRRTPQLNQLSDREYEILVRLANGEGYEEIANLLEISTSTVRSYRSRIMHKLGITTATEMIKFAVRHRIIDLS